MRNAFLAVALVTLMGEPASRPEAN